MYTEGELTQRSRARLGQVLRDVQTDAASRGYGLRCVGSLGVCSLLDTEPRILRKSKVDEEGGWYREVVDIDLLLGWEAGTDHRKIKQWADYWWGVGMSKGETVRFPVSVVNLPGDIANDRGAVLNFEWILGKSFSYVGRDNKVVDLPLLSVENRVRGSIFGVDVETLTPAAHVLFKLVTQQNNPLRWVKNVKQALDLVRKYPLARKNIVQYEEVVNKGMSALVIGQIGRLSHG